MINRFNKKSWRRLFLRLAGSCLALGIVIAVANGSLFLRYFTYHEQKVLRSCADVVAEVDISSKDNAITELAKLENDHNVEINISVNNITVYSTLRQSLSLRGGMSGFDFLFGELEQMQVLESASDRYGGVFSLQRNNSGTEFIVYSKSYGNRTVEVMIPNSYVESSARLATRFVLMVTVIGTAVFLFLSIYLSVRFTRPITQMNDVALNMTKLDFSQKVDVTSDDEIGTLADSLNTLSDSLCSTLGELKEKNAMLEKEIEHERLVDRMRKDFVANASHELKTPISIIHGYAEGLKDSVVTDEESRKRYCEVILDETDRMHKLVISLLELSRYESGIEINPVQFDLSASVINIVDVNSDAIERSTARLSLSLPERLTVTADRLMIEQVLQNYISNAVSHVTEGGEIKIYTEDYSNNIRLCVFNSGNNIEPDDMEGIWQSFYRVDKAHSRAQGRFGLGLSIVKAIMLAHSKDFGVFNTDGGVVFWIEIEKCLALPPADETEKI